MHNPIHKSILRRSLENIASILLMIVMVFFAALALTALIIFVEEVITFIVKGRLINTYTNVYGNAVGVVGWHFLIVFFIVAYWSLLDVFHPLVYQGEYDTAQYLKK
ncbi:hypothetical protein ACJQWY_03390 [Weissella kandleri]|uniref:hypothetical protein n=1 Tax=Weissella kandleri TaxID=1616 RepID=UPI00387E6AA4